MAPAERFGDIALRPQAQRGQFIDLGIAHRQKYHGDAAGRGLGPQFLAEDEPAHAGHFQVQEDQGGGTFQYLFQGLLRGLREGGGVAFILEGVDDHLAELQIVVNNEDLSFHSH